VAEQDRLQPERGPYRTLADVLAAYRSRRRRQVAAAAAQYVADGIGGDVDRLLDDGLVTPGAARYLLGRAAEHQAQLDSYLAQADQRLLRHRLGRCRE
jgi:hypothetical protein